MHIKRENLRACECMTRYDTLLSLQRSNLPRRCYCCCCWCQRMQ
jgi:hypothetical protein